MRMEHALTDRISLDRFLRVRSRKRKRLRLILVKLFSYGFEEVAIRLHLGGGRFIGLLARSRDRAHHRDKPLAVRLRLLLEELGPTFVKLGQVMSLRSDLLPDEITGELRKLQTQVPPFPGDEAVRIVEAELRRPLSELFARFDRAPVAAASISQVHEAILKNGRRVAVKIQRPRTREVVEIDLALLKDAARLAERYIPSLRIYKPQEVIAQFAQTLETELDFLHEGRTMALFQDLFGRKEGIAIPDVHWQHTTERVLTMDYVEGTLLSELLADANGHPGIDRRLVAKRGVSYLLEQIFEHGIFNADPHPGNFIVLSDGVLGAVDFGMIGSLDGRMQSSLLDAMEAFFRRDSERLVRIFITLDLIEDESEISHLRQALTNLVNYYYNIRAADLRAERILSDLNAIIRRFRISIPVELTLVLKVIITLEGFGKKLDPDFSVVNSIRPFMIRHYAAQLNPKRRARDLAYAAADFLQVAKDLPYDAGVLLQKLKSGRLKIQMEHRNLSDLVLAMGRSINRLAFAVIIAGILVGSSLMMGVRTVPMVLGMPLIALAGYLVSGVLGLWLIVSIIRSGHL